MPGSYPTGVFAKSHIANIVEPILNSPVAADECQQFLGVCPIASHAANSVGCFFSDFPIARARPAFEFEDLADARPAFLSDGGARDRRGLNFAEFDAPMGLVDRPRFAPLRSDGASASPCGMTGTHLECVGDDPLQTLLVVFDREDEIAFFSTIFFVRSFWQNAASPVTTFPSTGIRSSISRAALCSLVFAFTRICATTA